MKHTASRSRQAGYTLIELLLYVAIVGILLGGLTVFFGMSASVRVKNQSVAEVDQQGTMAMQVISQTIRNGDAITLPAAAGTGAQLTLTVPTASLSPTIVNLSGATLQIKQGTAAAVDLTSPKVQVSNLTFKNLTRPGTQGSVQVSFTVSRTNVGGTNDYDYQKTFTTTASIR